jgi:hypothetical protein
MAGGLQSYLRGTAVLGLLGLLGGCGAHYLMAEREAWRRDAEVQCLNSGAVREGAGKVRISSIDGPGACGIDFPLKVASLGNTAPLSYVDDPRPPASIPNPPAPPPRWPIAPAPGPGVARQDLPAPGAGPLLPNQPLALDPSGTGEARGAPPEPYDFRKPYSAPKPAGPVAGPAVSAPAPSPSPSPFGFSPQPYGPRQIAGPPDVSRPISSPPYGPLRSSQALALAGPVSVSPPATLACPLVSALDQWIDEAVQPAALKWFGEPVVEIKQISAYSCRGMNGDPNAAISEHAFGNALDIAAFILADGRKVTVQYGWHGAPQEQAFLHDVQAAACDAFTTVLAPGSNAFHYNHMHVDLMRRHDGHHACDPRAVPGDEVAARLGFHLAARRVDPVVTASISQRRTTPPKPMGASGASDRRPARDLPAATPGADGEK